MSTVAAVEDMLTRGHEAAAIATERASVIYGATVLEREIDDNPNNQTRFVILAHGNQPPTGDDKTSVCFSFDEDAPGILHSVLGEFATRGINLTKIESRPTKQDLGRYVFLVDLTGHKEDQVVKDALTGVEAGVSMFKVFGSYPRHNAAY
jgi:prephenate dehydratase